MPEKETLEEFKFIPDNSIDFFPDGVESDTVIEKKYTNKLEIAWKKVENRIKKVFLI